MNPDLLPVIVGVGQINDRPENPLEGRDPVALHEGDQVVVRRAAVACTFARVFPPSTFYARLPQRLRRDS